MKPWAALFLSCLFCHVVASPGVASAEPQAPDRPLGVPSPDSALVYFVREEASSFLRGTASVFCDDRLVAVLPNDSYSFVKVTPGTHVVWVRLRRTAEKPLLFDFAHGQTYYGGFSPDSPVRLMSRADGLAAVARAERYRALTVEDTRNGDRTIAHEWAGLKDTLEAAMARFGGAAYAPPDSTEGMVRVPAGTRIRAVLCENLSSEFNQPGDPVWMRAADFVAVGGAVLADRGAAIAAVVRGVWSVDSWGRGGVIDAAAVSLVTRDGTTCPLIGQVVSTGHEVSTFVPSLVAGGLWGGLMTGGRADIHPLGELVEVFTRQDIWLSPDSPRVAEDAFTPLLDPLLRITAPGTVAFDLRTSRIPTSVKLRLEGVGDITSAELVAVAGVPVPKPLRAQEISEESSGLFAAFAGWDICRYLPSQLASKTMTIRITKSDGSFSFGEVTIAVDPAAEQ